MIKCASKKILKNERLQTKTDALSIPWPKSETTIFWSWEVLRLEDLAGIK